MYFISINVFIFKQGILFSLFTGFIYEVKGFLKFWVGEREVLYNVCILWWVVAL